MRALPGLLSQAHRLPLPATLSSATNPPTRETRDMVSSTASASTVSLPLKSRSSVLMRQAAASGEARVPRGALPRSLWRVS